MRRWSATKSIASTLRALVNHPQRPLPFVSPAILKPGAVSSDFLKWDPVGSCRGYSRFASRYTPMQQKPLDKIVDIERLKDRSAEEIADAWDDYHLGRGHIGLSMKAKDFYLLEHRAAQCRCFVIPIWRGRGYVNMFVQVQMPYILFTGLEDYKARGSEASPYLTVAYYKEFAESKDLVLVRGDVVFTSMLSDEEAKFLMETAQTFYLSDMRYKLVERFNKETQEFEFKDVLQALDMPVL